MKQPISAGVLLAALPAAALAQAIHFDISDIPAPGDTVTITMLASFDSQDYAIAGISTSVQINRLEGYLSDPRLIAPMDGPGTSEGIIARNSVDGIIAGQLNFPPAGIYADPTNPIAFWAVDWTYDAGSGERLNIESRTDRFDVYTDRMLGRSESRIDEVEEDSLIIFVPAPGSALALVGGLALTARRRR